MFGEPAIKRVKISDNAWQMVARDGTNLNGLHQVMTEHFYPEYSYEEAKLGPSCGPYDMAAAVTYEFKGQSFRHKTGTTAGIGLDVGIKRCIDNNESPGIEHPDTCAFFASVAAHKMKAKTAQLGVCDTNLRLGTFIDAVCVPVDKDRVEQPGVFLLEVKTGFNHCLLKHKGKMRAPLDTFDDSPHNQHHLQLLLSRYLFQKTYPGIEIKDCFIVYVSHTTVCWVSLNSKLAALSVGIIDAIRPVEEAKAEQAEERRVAKRATPKFKKKKPHRKREEIVRRAMFDVEASEA